MRVANLDVEEDFWVRIAVCLVGCNRPGRLNKLLVSRHSRRFSIRSEQRPLPKRLDHGCNTD